MGLKARRNLRKHNIDFADAVAVFSDDLALTIVDEEHTSEDRSITIGMDGLGRVLVVVYTWRRSRIRIISARRATRREQAEYIGEE
ncbi:MAG: hypothetical protein DCC55_10785 [Chloroflexi bacterium]|nr:MAG: hypothetical protein DCC55_10785 [Chloroflexota bacterium]